MRRKREKCWRTKGGELIPYRELTDTHLENILNFIKNKAEVEMYETIIVGVDLLDIMVMSLL